MEPKTYDGTIHPEVWLNRIKEYCYKHQITKNEDIIEFCKSKIHPSINVTKAITFDEIVNVLKSDFLFISFKYSIKKKLEVLKFDPKHDRFIPFINKFRKYCYEAEINNIEEQKKSLLKILPEDSFQYIVLNDNLEKIKTLSDLITSLNEETKFIRSGSCIALKHIATGRYLSSSSNGMVFASQVLLNPNSLWIVSKLDDENNNDPINYENDICLTNKGIEKYLDISNDYESPTGHQEVNCDANNYPNLGFINNLTNSNSNYIKTQDIINLQGSGKFILREFPFTIDNEIFQDEWCIELVRG